MTFNEELLQRTDRVNELIKGYFPTNMIYRESILDAMMYSLCAGGKRIRPIIMESFFKLFGGTGRIIEPFMVAMEMLHSYSLVHDDLPAIDNDDFRRGNPTTHKKYGEAVGVLSGDGLLHLAYETMLKAFDLTDEYENVIKAMKIFGEKTGLEGMFGGQAVDVINTGRDIDESLMRFIYEKKTSALIEGSMMIGAALAGANETEIYNVSTIGSLIGLAFQIKDDILDVEGDEKELGKPVNSDERNNKKTYVAFFGVDKARESVSDYTQKASSKIYNLGESISEREFLVELFRYLILRNK